MKKIIAIILGALLFGLPGCAIGNEAGKTDFPVVFAHGMGGFDDILGFDYWGDDYGVFVLDPCDKSLEFNCNGYIDDNQESFIASVTPFHNSEQRGYELYQDIKGYMATSGHSYVNIVGHSQGGIDLRKAATLLYNDKGYTVVKFGISVSSPHRGSPLAQYILNMEPGVVSIMETLATYFGDIVYGSGNESIESLKQLVFDDYDSGDGKKTGMKEFNKSWPLSANSIQHAYSFITGQNGLSMNPALYLIAELWTVIDGDGYATYDANGDGAMGTGNGDPEDDDDDGLVGINSQQMGYRMNYLEFSGSLDIVYKWPWIDYCGDLNAPDSTMMTSHEAKVNQDHADIIGVGPDTFDEMEFYGAITAFISNNGG